MCSTLPPWILYRCEKTIYICTAFVFTKTSKSPKISTMVNDCLAVRDSHQHRLQHLSPGSEGAIFACLQGCMYIYTYMCVCACYNIYIYACVCACVINLIYICVCVSMHIYMQLYGIDLIIIYLSIYLCIYLSIYLSIYRSIFKKHKLCI